MKKNATNFVKENQFEKVVYKNGGHSVMNCLQLDPQEQNAMKFESKYISISWNTFEEVVCKTSAILPTLRRTYDAITHVTERQESIYKCAILIFQYFYGYWLSSSGYQQNGLKSVRENNEKITTIHWRIIDLIHTSHNAPVPYPIMQHSK